MIQKSAEFRIVISALEVIETGFGVVIIAAVAKRIDFSHGSGGSDYIAVGIVIIARNYCSGSVYQGHYIALKVGDVIVEGTVVLQRIGCSAGIIEEIEGVIPVNLPKQLTARIVISMGDSIDCFCQSLAVRIIGEGQIPGAVGGRIQLLARGPGEIPSCAVVIAGGIVSSLYFIPTPTAREKALESKDSRASLRYGLIRIGFRGQKTGCWDDPKPLKVSGIVLTSAVVSQRRCLLV